MDAGTSKGIPNLSEILVGQSDKIALHNKKERWLALLILWWKVLAENRQPPLIFFLHLFLVLLDEGLLDVVRDELVRAERSGERCAAASQ